MFGSNTSVVNRHGNGGRECKGALDEVEFAHED